MTTVAVLHPGSMGAAIARQALRNAESVLWCPGGRSARTVRRAEESGLTPESSLPGLLSRADIVLSICPPGRVADDIARRVAEESYAGLFVEANAISPQHVRRIAGQLLTAGARMVDGALIGHPPVDEPDVTLYLAGDARDTVEVVELFRGTNCLTRVLDGPAGTASGLKCAFSSYQKSVHALAGLSYALADFYGVREQLHAEAARRAPGSPLAQPERLSQGAAKAWRWAPEFAEIVDALTAARLPPGIARAVADLMDSWADLKDDPAADLSIILAHLEEHRVREGRGSG